MIDAQLVRRKIKLIGEDLPHLAQLAARARSAFVASHVDELVAERLLERIIGRMIDINYHLLTQAGEAPPSDYHQSFTRLAPLMGLPFEFAQRIASCAGLRNRLVHEYDTIDPVKVHDALQAAARDIPEYLSLVHAYLERRAGSTDRT